MSRHLDSSTTTQMAKIMVQYGRPSRSSWAQSLRSSFGRTIVEKAIWDRTIYTRLGKSSKLGMFIRQPRKRTTLICDVWTITKLAGKKQNINPTWKILMNVDLGGPTSFLDHAHLGCTQKECKISRDIVDNYRSMFESRISARATENCQKQKPRRNLMPKRYLHGLVTWKVMQRNAWKEIANWRIKQLSNYTM